jgi:hypothetical protein
VAVAAGRAKHCRHTDRYNRDPDQTAARASRRRGAGASNVSTPSSLRNQPGDDRGQEHRRWGDRITRHPAAVAERMPVGESSSATQSFGETDKACRGR